jgi:hypothetical protein
MIALTYATEEVVTSRSAYGVYFHQVESLAFCTDQWIHSLIKCLFLVHLFDNPYSPDEHQRRYTIIFLLRMCIVTRFVTRTDTIFLIIP